MEVLVLLLLLSSLTLAPVHSRGTYEKFMKQHMYNGNSLVDCTQHMNMVLKKLNVPCKRCNTIILGEDHYSTDVNEVTQVCSSGTSPDGKTYTSQNEFRVVKCSLRTPGGQPPDCDYKKVTEKNIQRKKLILTCENNRPVHFNPC